MNSTTFPKAPSDMSLERGSVLFPGRKKTIILVYGLPRGVQEPGATPTDKQRTKLGALILGLEVEELC